MIFNRDDRGSEELAQLTGTFYAATDFLLIKEDLRLAQQELKRFIGKELFDKALTMYKGSKPDSDFVRRVQMPIIYKAMYHFYQRNIVSHEGSGRKLNLSENEKAPWAWMLEKDDEVLMNTHYRNLDELFLFLEEQKEEDYKEWKASPLRKRLAESLVSSLSDFEEVYPLNGSYYTFYTMIPFIKETEHRFIAPLLEGATLTDDMKTTARRFIVLHTMILAVERLSISAFPTGIAQRFTDSFQGRSGKSKPSLEHVQSYLSTLKKQADDALQVFKKRLKPSGDYPLTPQNDKDNKFFTV